MDAYSTEHLRRASSVPQTLGRGAATESRESPLFAHTVNDTLSAHSGGPRAAATQSRPNDCRRARVLAAESTVPASAA